MEKALDEMTGNTSGWSTSQLVDSCGPGVNNDAQFRQSDRKEENYSRKSASEVVRRTGRVLRGGQAGIAEWRLIPTGWLFCFKVARGDSRQKIDIPLLPPAQYCHLAN